VVAHKVFLFTSQAICPASCKLQCRKRCTFLSMPCDHFSWLRSCHPLRPAASCISCNMLCLPCCHLLSLISFSRGRTFSLSGFIIQREASVLHPFGKERNHSIGVIDHLIIGLLFDPNSGARAKIVLHMDSNLSSSRQGEKLDGDQSADDVDPTHPGIKQAGF